MLVSSAFPLRCIARTKIKKKARGSSLPYRRPCPDAVVDGGMRARRTRCPRPLMGLQALLAFVARDERAPWLGADRTLGLPHHVELTVARDFADHDRLVQVMVGLVHRQGEGGRRLEGLGGH